MDDEDGIVGFTNTGVVYAVSRYNRQGGVAPSLVKIGLSAVTAAPATAAPATTAITMLHRLTTASRCTLAPTTIPSTPTCARRSRSLRAQKVLDG